MAFVLIVLLANSDCGGADVTVPNGTRVPDLSNIAEFGDFRAHFNDGEDIPKLIRLFSPTCGLCLEGAGRVQKQILNEYPVDNLRLYSI